MPKPRKSLIALDVCAYAVMSTTTLCSTARSWTTTEVIERWYTLFKGTVPTHRYLDNILPTEAERKKAEDD